MHAIAEIANLGTIATVFAHPDDESWLAAGVLMAARLNDQRVSCITATLGEAGVQDESRWPAAKLGEIRRKELIESLKILDITNHHWLNYKNDYCDQVDPQEAVQKLVALLDKIQPHTIITFGPDGFSGHPDHQTVGRWADAAALQLAHVPKVLHVAVTREWYAAGGKEWDDKFNVFYNLEKPNLIAEADATLNFHLPPQLVRRKLKALRAQPSQTEKTFATLSASTMDAIAKHESFLQH